jgi:hypothetical protein
VRQNTEAGYRTQGNRPEGERYHHAGGDTNEVKHGGGVDYLVPNEVRISLAGRFTGQVGHILFILRSGYSNCKVVGRGTAGERINEIANHLQK